MAQTAALDTAPPINDRREIFGWTMYDWANSAFSTTVVTVLLGPLPDGAGAAVRSARTARLRRSAR